VCQKWNSAGFSPEKSCACGEKCIDFRTVFAALFWRRQCRFWPGSVKKSKLHVDLALQSGQLLQKRQSLSGVCPEQRRLPKNKGLLQNSFSRKKCTKRSAPKGF